MRIAVTGGRKFVDREAVDRALSAVHRKHRVTLLIQGEASGADSLCKAWARRNGVQTLDLAAQWDNIARTGAVVRRRRDGTLYDAAAGGERNQRMIDEGRPEAAVAFPGGRGTADMVARLRRCGVPVWHPT